MATTYLNISLRRKNLEVFLKNGINRLLILVAVVLVILWLIGFVVYALGPILYLLLVIAHAFTLISEFFENRSGNIVTV